VFTDDYVTSPFYAGETRGWPLEAAIGALNEVAAAQDKAARMLVIFSEGIGATTTIPEDVADRALDLGIPIYPVATNYMGKISDKVPRNEFRMHQFEALGDMTGGYAVECRQIDTATLSKILGGVETDGLAQYLVGFVPSSGNGLTKVHTLEVKLKSKSKGSIEGGKRRASY
jgi:hypothetical protein